MAAVYLRCLAGIQLLFSAMQVFQLPLTPTQAAFLQTLLPHSHSFQPSPLDSKRPRAAKKIDDSFTADFTISARRLPTPAKPPKHQPNPHQDPCNAQQPPSEARPLASSTFEQASQYEQARKKLQLELEDTLGKILRQLRGYKSSWPFRNPVDPVAQQVPEYLIVIKEPMDLKTVERKLKQGLYKSLEDFDADIRKIISNSYTFNGEETSYYSITKEFQEYYSYLLTQHSPGLLLQQPHRQKKHKECIQGNLLDTTPRKQAKSNKEARTGCKAVSEGIIESVCEHGSQSSLGQRVPMKQLKFRERERLFNKINKLSQQGLCNFIRLCGVNTAMDWSEMQIDLAELSEQSFKKIEVFLNEN